MFQKINLVTALAALILFFLPWIDIQCSGKSMATQTGMQIQIRNLPALYIELIMLSLPTLILANGLIERMKRG